MDFNGKRISSETHHRSNYHRKYNKTFIFVPRILLGIIMMKLKYAIVGTGALGGFYGGMLANAGNDVHFLFNHDYDFVCKNGLKIDSVCRIPLLRAFREPSWRSTSSQITG